MRRVAKPWGHEGIWAQTERYVGKILHIEAGKRLSLQYHEHKDETILLQRGEMILSHGPSVDALVHLRLGEGESFRIRPGTVHRMEALSDCEVLEVSTPELDDVVRLLDDYGRETQGGAPPTSRST